MSTARQTCPCGDSVRAFCWRMLSTMAVDESVTMQPYTMPSRGPLHQNVSRNTKAMVSSTWEEPPRKSGFLSRTSSLPESSMPMENMRKATPTSAMVSTASGLGMSPRAEGPHSTPVSRKPTMDGRRKRRQTRTTMMERIKRTTISRRIMSSMGQSRRKGYGEVNHVFTSLLFCHVFRPHATERRADAGGRNVRSEDSFGVRLRGASEGAGGAFGSARKTARKDPRNASCASGEKAARTPARSVRPGVATNWSPECGLKAAGRGCAKLRARARKRGGCSVIFLLGLAGRGRGARGIL